MGIVTVVDEALALREEFECHRRRKWLRFERRFPRFGHCVSKARPPVSLELWERMVPERGFDVSCTPTLEPERVTTRRHPKDSTLQSPFPLS